MHPLRAAVSMAGDSLSRHLSCAGSRLMPVVAASPLRAAWVAPRPAASTPADSAQEALNGAALCNGRRCTAGGPVAASRLCNVPWGGIDGVPLCSARSSRVASRVHLIHPCP